MAVLSRDRLRNALVPLAVAIVAFTAARMAMLPGLGYWDTAELQVVAPVMGTAHPTGFPTYVLLGWLANLLLSPFGEPALRMNLFAALCVAGAAAVTVDLVRTLTRSTPLGALAGLALAVTPSVWAIGTRAEAHALHLLLLAVLVRLLVGWEAAERRDPTGEAGAVPRDPRADRWLVAAAVVFGLSVGNHSLTLLLAPPVGLFVLAVSPGILRRPKLVAACALALVATIVLVFLELPLRAGPFRAPLVYGRPETWDGFWYIVLAEQFRGSLMDPFGGLDAKGAALAARVATQFGALAILIPAGFVATAILRPRYALLSGLATAITVFFAASYDNADIGRYYLGPILFAWTWLAILAAAAIDAILAAITAAPLDPEAEAAGDPGVPGAPSPATLPAAPGLSPRTALTVILAALLLVPTAVALPARHRLVDARADTDAQRWVDAVMTAMAPDAVVLSWWSYSTPLWYAQHVDGRRPDVTVIDDRTRLDQDLGDIIDVIDAMLPTRPVYVIRDDPAEISLLQARYVLEPVTGQTPRFLMRVVAPREAGA